MFRWVDNSIRTTSGQKDILKSLVRNKKTISTCIDFVIVGYLVIYFVLVCYKGFVIVLMCGYFILYGWHCGNCGFFMQ